MSDVNRLLALREDSRVGHNDGLELNDVKVNKRRQGMVYQLGGG